MWALLIDRRLQVSIRGRNQAVRVDQRSGSGLEWRRGQSGCAGQRQADDDLTWVSCAGGRTWGGSAPDHAQWVSSMKVVGSRGRVKTPTGHWPRPVKQSGGISGRPVRHAESVLIPALPHPLVDACPIFWPMTLCAGLSPLPSLSPGFVAQHLPARFSVGGCSPEAF